VPRYKSKLEFHMHQKLAEQREEESVRKERVSKCGKANGATTNLQERESVF